MLMRYLSGAFVGLAASLSVATVAHAGLVDFEDRPFSLAGNSFVEGGLDFTGGQFYFVVPPNPIAKQPLGAKSVFLQTYLAPTDTSILGFSPDGGGPFDLLYLHLGLGDFNAGALDKVTLTGFKDGCDAVADPVDCTVTADLMVGPRFRLFNLTNFTGLSSVSVAPQVTAAGGVDIGYLAFDSIGYYSAATGAPPPGVPDDVPEPALWAMMIMGFGGVGAMLRRGRRGPALAAPA